MSLRFNDERHICLICSRKRLQNTRINQLQETQFDTYLLCVVTDIEAMYIVLSYYRY